MNSQTLNFFVNLCEKSENPVCECVVNHSGFCSDPDTDPTRGSDPDLDPIPVPSRSRSGPEGTRIRNILTSPTIQVFFLSLSPSKLQISCFSRQHLACICLCERLWSSTIFIYLSKLIYITFPLQTAGHRRYAYGFLFCLVSLP